jgi:hypothetical protein
VRHAGRRYIVCRNEAEAEKDRTERQAIIAGLEQQLQRGDKALIGNSAYRRSNARVTPLQAMLRYRELLEVENLFRRTKTVLRTRPIYHSSDAAIRGHVFCSFLALVLQKELFERCRAASFTPEWDDVLRDLDRLQEVALTKDGHQIRLRTPATGTVGPLFKAAGIALPPNSRDTVAS